MRREPYCDEIHHQAIVEIDVTLIGTALSFNPYFISRGNVNDVILSRVIQCVPKNFAESGILDTCNAYLFHAKGGSN